MRIGFKSMPLSDLPDDHRIISSLSFFNRVKVNNTDKKTHIGTVSNNILGSKSITYEKYEKNEIFSDVKRSICLKPCPIHKMPLINETKNKKLDAISLITYVVNLDIFSIISEFL